MDLRSSVFNVPNAKGQPCGLLPPFVMVKVLDEKYADRLLNKGEVFMQPLRKYGAWSALENHNDPTYHNNFRGDLREGAIATLSPSESGAHFAKMGFSEDLCSVVKDAWFVDAGEIQFFKVYCMYAMRLNPATGMLTLPNPRIGDFGNKAVVIKDMRAFVNRLLAALLDEYGMGNFALFGDLVTYYDQAVSQPLNPLFNKSNAYQWESEVRIAFADGIQVPTGGVQIDLSSEPVILNIGSIDDIAFELDVEDFINGLFPEDFRFNSANRQFLDEEKTLFDAIVEGTRIEMQKYSAPCVNPMFAI